MTLFHRPVKSRCQHLAIVFYLHPDPISTWLWEGIGEANHVTHGRVHRSHSHLLHQKIISFPFRHLFQLADGLVDAITEDSRPGNTVFWFVYPAQQVLLCSNGVGANRMKVD